MDSRGRLPRRSDYERTCISKPDEGRDRDSERQKENKQKHSMSQRQEKTRLLSAKTKYSRVLIG